MASAIIDSQGQVSIPKEIREYLQVKEGSKIDFVIDLNGDVKLIPLNVSVEALSGILYRPGQKTVSIEEMEDAIREGASDWT